jgi:cytochrome P450
VKVPTRGKLRHAGLALRGQTRRAVEDCALRYGEAFTLWLPVGVPSVFLSAPAAVREVFTGEDEALRGGEANGFLRPLLGANSILCLDGARHERERRLMMPPFHGERMLAYGRTMQAVSEGGWRRGRQGVRFRSTARCSSSPSM